MKRHLLSVLAVAAFASFAGAQERTPAQSDAKPVAKSTMKKSSRMHRTTYTSAGSIDRGGPGYSVHAVARDYARADDTHGDDLWRREQLMDAKCGKSRERCGKP